jgi:hypothetical protein
MHVRTSLPRIVMLYVYVVSDLYYDGGSNCVDDIPSPSLPHQETSRQQPLPCYLELLGRMAMQNLEASM